MKKIFIVIGIIAALFLLTWGVCEVAESDYYNYAGYVIEVGEDSDGNTTIVTLSGNVESTFTVKWYTKMKAPKKQPIAVGDRVMLTTTHYSDTNIKKMKVSPAYSFEGVLVYMDGLVSPFVLSTQKETGARYLVSIVGPDVNMLSDIDAGDTVKVYHEYPISMSTVTVTYEAVTKLSDGSIGDLTAEDTAFIESQGYKLRGNAE